MPKSKSDKTTVLKFTGKHRREMVDHNHAKQLRQQILDMPLPEQTRAEMLSALSRNTASENCWTFIMLSPQQNRAVARYLDSHSKRPREALMLWAELFLSVRMDTGEILQTRQELAEAVGITVNNVSRIMTELEKINAIKRSRERIPGVRGAGRVRYFMNPNIATTIGSKVDREEAQKAHGQISIFDVIEGGKA